MGKSITDLSSVTTVGLDLAKHVFQVHGVDASGRVVVTKAIRRNKLLEFFASLPPCLVGLEASGSAHHWARELIKLGHDARMMPPAYVKPYIRRQKNDASDAAAICEAVTRPSMRFVGVRSLMNQAALMRHKTREMLVSQRTQLLNALRGHLTEVGVIAPQGLRFARLGAPVTSDGYAASASTGGAMAPVIIATASDIVTAFGSTTVRRRPKRWIWMRSATSNTWGMLWEIRMIGMPRFFTSTMSSSTRRDSLTPSAAVGSSMITTR